MGKAKGEEVGDIFIRGVAADTTVNNERAKTQSRTLLTFPSNEKLCRCLIKFLDFIALSATTAGIQTTAFTATYR